jgi:hypothetical protein
MIIVVGATNYMAGRDTNESVADDHLLSAGESLALIERQHPEVQRGLGVTAAAQTLLTGTRPFACSRRVDVSGCRWRRPGVRLLFPECGHPLL